MATETLKEITYENKKVVVEVARRDASGNTIDATYVKKTGDAMSGVLKINEIDNSAGNALVRYKSSEGKNVFGGSNYGCTLMGNEDRPRYSKDGSSFTGSELALKSDISTTAKNLYMHAIQLYGSSTSKGTAIFFTTVISSTKSFSTSALTSEFAGCKLAGNGHVGTYNVVGANISESGQISLTYQIMQSGEGAHEADDVSLNLVQDNAHLIV